VGISGLRSVPRVSTPIQREIGDRSQSLASRFPQSARRRSAVRARLDSRRAPVLLSEVLRRVVRLLAGVPHGPRAAERARFADAHETGVTWLFAGFHGLILAEKYSK
jgi:hypothetical protein